MNKKVSIVIPSYNSEAFIVATVESAFAQTYPNIEVICVDNNSTDNTPKILLSLKDRFPQLILSTESKQNACAARNNGMDISTGEWIQFLDSDDLIKPDKILNQMSIISLMPSDTPFVVGSYVKSDLQKDLDEQVKAYYDPWKGLIYNKLGQTSANLFNKKSIEDIGGWNDDLKSSQEYDLMFRLLIHNNEIARSYENYTIVQVRDGSISASDVMGNQHRYLHFLSRVIDYMRLSKPEEYSKIDPDFFQKTFVRIRLSAINGYPDFEYFYDKIIPQDVVIAGTKFTPMWFSAMSLVLGYKNTERFRNVVRGVRKY